jgi:hypothetical protein
MTSVTGIASVFVGGIERRSLHFDTRSFCNVCRHGNIRIGHDGFRYIIVTEIIAAIPLRISASTPLSATTQTCFKSSKALAMAMSSVA